MIIIIKTKERTMQMYNFIATLATRHSVYIAVPPKTKFSYTNWTRAVFLK